MAFPTFLGQVLGPLVYTLTWRNLSSSGSPPVEVCRLLGVSMTRQSGAAVKNFGSDMVHTCRVRVYVTTSLQLVRSSVGHFGLCP